MLFIVFLFRSVLITVRNHHQPHHREKRNRKNPPMTSLPQKTHASIFTKEEQKKNKENTEEALRILTLAEKHAQLASDAASSAVDFYENYKPATDPNRNILFTKQAAEIAAKKARMSGLRARAFALAVNTWPEFAGEFLKQLAHEYQAAMSAEKNAERYFENLQQKIRAAK